MRGFSLLEIILYVGLLSLMFSGLFSSISFLHDATLQSERAAEDLIAALNARDALDIGTHDL